MRHCLILPLLGCFACDAVFSDTGPNAPTAPLSTFSVPRVTFSVNRTRAYVVISVGLPGNHSVRCPVLDDDFRATIGGVPFHIVERGASEDSTDAFDPCAWPQLALDQPPVAPAATLVMQYAAREIVVDLSDLLAERSVQLVPDGPWTFSPGQTITLRWSPLSDLEKYMPRIYFDGVYSEAFPITIAGDEMTFNLLNAAGAESLSFWMMIDPSDLAPWPECSGAICTIDQRPAITHPIVWQ